MDDFNVGDKGGKADKGEKGEKAEKWDTDLSITNHVVSLVNGLKRLFGGSTDDGKK